MFSSGETPPVSRRSVTPRLVHGSTHRWLAVNGPTSPVPRPACLSLFHDCRRPSRRRRWRNRDLDACFAVALSDPPPRFAETSRATFFRAPDQRSWFHTTTDSGRPHEGDDHRTFVRTTRFFQTKGTPTPGLYVTRFMPAHAPRGASFGRRIRRHGFGISAQTMTAPSSRQRRTRPRRCSRRRLSDKNKKTGHTRRYHTLIRWQSPH